ncbi:unnamed protein product, partial [Effrenium voratum]
CEEQKRRLAGLDLTGIRPLDDLMQKMRDDATVMFYMLPTLMTARAHYPEKVAEEISAPGSFAAIEICSGTAGLTAELRRLGAKQSEEHPQGLPWLTPRERQRVDSANQIYAFALRGEEKRLMDALPPHRRKVLQGKRLVLLREILQDAGYPDVKLAEDIAAGFDLVGETERSEAMPDHLLPATISIDELLDTAPGANRGIYHSTKSCGDPQVDEQLWEKTAKELADGWLVGPLPISSVELEGRLSRRFPIVQGGKVRPIDNYSESQVNDAITVVNRATVDGTDVQAAMAASLIRELDKAGASKCIKGMSFDLTSAYRQLAVTSCNAELSFSTLLDLLGWRYDKTGDKSDTMTQVVRSLGAKSAVTRYPRMSNALSVR